MKLFSLKSPKILNVKIIVSAIGLLYLMTNPLALGADDFFNVKKNIIDRAFKKILLFYVTPTLELNQIGYNSNIYYYDDIAQGDWTADLGVNLKLSLILKNRFIFEFVENPSYSFYAENKHLESFNNSYSFSTYTHLGRINLKYSYSKGDRRSNVSQEQGPRTRIYQSENSLTLDYGRHNNFYISIYLSQVSLSFEEELYLNKYDLTDLNRTELTAGASVNKVIFSRTLLSLNYEQRKYEFELSDLRDGNAYKFSLGIKFPEISSITGSLKFGYNNFKPKEPAYQAYFLPFGEGRVSVKLFGRIKCNFSYMLDFYNSIYNNDEYYINNSFGAGFEFYLSKKIKIGYNYGYGRRSYESIISGDEQRFDNLYSANIYIGYKIFSNTGFGIFYTRYRSESSIQDFSRSNNFIGGNLIYEF